MRLLSRYLLNPNDRRVFRSFYLWIVLVFLTSRERERVNPIILEQATPFDGYSEKNIQSFILTLIFDQLLFVDFAERFACRALSLKRKKSVPIVFLCARFFLKPHGMLINLYQLTFVALIITMRIIEFNFFRFQCY